MGCSPWSLEESDTTECLHFHFSLSCIGEGNGNPLQCSCLENPRDGGAWGAAVCGVAQSRTRLKWLSSLAAGLEWRTSSAKIQAQQLEYLCLIYTVLPCVIIRVPVYNLDLQLLLRNCGSGDAGSNSQLARLWCSPLEFINVPTIPGQTSYSDKEVVSHHLYLWCAADSL